VKFFYLSLLLICIGLFSCQGGKKARGRAKKTIETSGDNNRLTKEKINTLTLKIEEKLGNDNIPDTIKFEINKRLDSYTKKNDSVADYILFIKERLASSRSFRRAYIDSIQPKIAYLEQHDKNSGLQIYKLNMIDESLDWAKQNKFELAAFFGPGKYIIPEDKYPQAIALFTPVIDSLILFSNKHASVKRTAYIVTLGFADAAGFNTESDTYKALIDSLKNPSPEKAILNRLLSHWRADEIGNLLDHSLLQQKAVQFKNIETAIFKIFNDGKGEEYPSKKIKDYTPEDSRRRVVLIFWSVLPD
jgi:hypothetical protein